MEKKHISERWNSVKGHKHHEFIDVATNSDNLLFIDPILIQSNSDEWSKKANVLIQSFFDAFYEAYRQADNIRKKELLSHAGEQNGTRFGYGRGDNGKGNTAQGLLEIFAPLEEYIFKISTIEKAEDLSILIPNFAEDGLSDMLTNILHDELNQFTSYQMAKYGIASKELLKFWTWDGRNKMWLEVERPAYFIEGEELLLVPKNIVRKNYLFSVHQYFTRIIIDRERKDGGYMSGGKLIPKQEIVKKKRKSGKHWEYNETILHTRNQNDALREYHEKLPLFYKEKRNIVDDNTLDKWIYGYIVR